MPERAIPQSGQRMPSSASRLAEPLAVLGEVDGVERRAEDREARGLDRPRELERRLAAELDHDAVGLLALADREHRLRVERLEVEAVGRVVVGRDGLGVAVDHHRLVAELAIGLDSVDAAVVELHSLPDAVRARAENHDALPVALRRALVLLAPGGVEVVRGRVDLARDGVDAPVDGRQRALALLFRGQVLRARGGTRGAGCRGATRSRPRARASPSRTPR